MQKSTVIWISALIVCMCGSYVLFSDIFTSRRRVTGSVSINTEGRTAEIDAQSGHRLQSFQPERANLEVPLPESKQDTVVRKVLDRTVESQNKMATDNAKDSLGRVEPVHKPVTETTFVPHTPAVPTPAQEDKHLGAPAGPSENSSKIPCTSQNMFNNPSLFNDCITFAVPCDKSNYQQWNTAVQLRYDKLKGCVSSRGSGFGPSGPGSSLANTKSLRDLLQKMFRDKAWGIKTFMDAPCGDWMWMQTVDLSGVQYFGGDITEVTVRKNNECFGKPNVRFRQFDLTCMIPPPVDLLLVRDVLFHLKYDLVLKVLHNINRSGAKFLATTTFKKGIGRWGVGMAYPDSLTKRGGRNQSVIGFSQLNLYKHPFNLSKPIQAANEGVREVGVWRLPLKLPPLPT